MRFFACVCVVLGSASAAECQELAFRTYQVSDGLAHGVVISLHQDGRGFLWLATYEGLSRFDGYGFTNFGPREGLGPVVVNDVTSDRRGHVWGALNGFGVAKLIDHSLENVRTGRRSLVPPAFTRYLIDRDERHSANAVNRILFDADNRLWCVTDAGLYRSTHTEIADGAFERVVPGRLPYFNNAAFADSRGRLWFGVGTQVVRVAQGRVTIYRPADDGSTTRDVPASKDIHTIVEDRTGRILAAETTGLYEFVERDAGAAGGAWHPLPLALEPDQAIRSMVPAEPDGLWIGTNAGLLRYGAGPVRLYTTENGLSSDRIRSLLRDREGNLWVGTEGSGVVKLSSDAVVGFTTRQGLPAREVHRLAEGTHSRVYATVGCAPRKLVMIADERVSSMPSDRLAPSQCYKSHLVRDAAGRTWYHTKLDALQDDRGHWWFLTARGLEFHRGPALDFARGRVVGAGDGFPESFYTEMYRDAEGQIWIVNGVSGKLYVAQAADDGRPHVRLVAAGLSDAELILRTRSGTVWVASSDAIWRVAHGKVEPLEARDGLPVIEPRALFEDGRGRVWIGSRYHGVSMTAEPDAPAPRFVNYSAANGLASDSVWSIAADERGSIYLGTGRGLDQLDPATGRSRHFTSADGVSGSVIEDVLRDRRGRIWIASDAGITRLDPRVATPAAPPPPIFVSRMQVAGEEWPLPVGGAERVASLELPASRNNLTIQFVGLSYRSEKLLRYQYKLEGATDDWSAPTDQREVNFAQLGPGAYRFLVRAIGSDDIPSANPASVEFRILPPVYRRAWFIALAALSFAALTYGVHRYRVARLLELMHVRTRIATDLHDDIGANLTRIAILSEVAQQQRAIADTQEAPLAAIARIARESVGAMSDIVWAISPDADTLHDLVRRMRDHAEGLFESRDIAVTLDLLEPTQPMKLGVNQRRDLYLIFKEAVNNAARHSRCSHVTVRFRSVGFDLLLEIADNGIGFDPAVGRDGHGLGSMQRRATRLGAVLDVDTGRAMGTSVRLAMRVGERRGWHRPGPTPIGS